MSASAPSNNQGTRGKLRRDEQQYQTEVKQGLSSYADFVAEFKRSFVCARYHFPSLQIPRICQPYFPKTQKSDTSTFPYYFLFAPESICFTHQRICTEVSARHHQELASILPKMSLPISSTLKTPSPIHIQESPPPKYSSVQGAGPPPYMEEAPSTCDSSPTATPTSASTASPSPNSTSPLSTNSRPPISVNQLHNNSSTDIFNDIPVTQDLDTWASRPRSTI
jgi:hypothetical protein